MRGVGGVTQALGSVTLKLEWGEAGWCPEFYVLEEGQGPNMPILGLSFLERTGAIVDLRREKLSLLWATQDMQIPLCPPEREGHSVTIPARHQCNVMLPVTEEGTVIIESQVLGPGIFVARTISKVHKGKAMARLMNTTQEEVTLCNVVLDSEPFDDNTAKETQGDSV